MRVLLIRYHDRNNINTRLPESLNKRIGVLPPLGIAYIAAVLERAGYEVGIIDAIALNLTREEVKERILVYKPRIVGITCMTPSFFGALEAAQIAKECGALVVLGGPHLAIYSTETLSYPYIDYGIIGEGEGTILELIRSLEERKSVSNIKGLAYKQNNEIFVNEARIVHNLDELPFPAFHLLPMKRYSSIIGLEPVTTMISTRGCPYQCSYCFKAPSDKEYRMRSPRNVVDEMGFVVESYGIKEIMFYDDAMTLSREHTVGICEEIIRRKLKVKWEVPTRIDKVDKELLYLMHKAGCIRLRYGIESGDPQILELMHKNISLEKAKEVFRWTKEAGIETFAYFMLGYAYETEDTIKRTISFALELNPDLLMFTAATPLPQTPLYHIAQEARLFEGDYWRDFTLGLSNEPIPYFFTDTEKWIKIAYRKFYLRPGYILRSLIKIRSPYKLRAHWNAAMGIFLFEMRKNN